MEHLFCSKRKHVEEKERSFCQLAILSGMTKLIYDRENNKLWTDGKSKHIYLHLPMEFSSWQDGGAPKVGWCAMLAEMLVSFSDDQKSEDIVLNFCCDWDPVAVDCAASCRYMRSAVDKPTPGYDARPDYVRLTWLLVQCHSVCICQVIISMGKWSARSMPPPSLHRLWRWL